jgi:hypothetical protein
MKRALCCLLLAYSASAAIITGVVRGPDGRPVAGATVRVDAKGDTKTDENGEFHLLLDAAGQHILSAESEGLAPVQQLVAGSDGDLKIDLAFAQPAPNHESVTVTADVSQGDILNPDPSQSVVIRQEILDANPGRPGAPVSIPGLPVETASSGIKAPQYFAPGVAGDHGESIAQFFQVGSYLAPNNLSANAHGNGYADPNPIIPAIIESVQTDGGAFNVREGNHSVNLAATYGFRSRLDPFVTLSADYRDVDLAAGWSPSAPGTRAWIALETSYGNGFLNALEHRQQHKLNGYRVFAFGRHTLTLFGTGYYGQSKIPGLVPLNAPGNPDTIDSRQRDQSHTGELAANDIWRWGSGSELHLSGFFRTYSLALYSNFGDGLIRQSEFRTAASGQASYVKKVSERLSLMAGVDYTREAPRRLDLDHYDSTDTAVYGPFQKVTANDVTLNFVSSFAAVDGRITPWLRYNLGWRRDEIGIDNYDRIDPANSFHLWTGVNSPKATFNVIAPGSLPLPSVSFSAGQAFITNDPRIGIGSVRGTPVSRAHSAQMVVSKTVLGTDVRVALGRTTQEQSMAKIDPDTGLQFDEGPSRNRYVTVSARHRFRCGMLQASFSKADARDLSAGTPLPEAPRMIFDTLGTIDRLPWHLLARGEFEEVGRKPLGDGFVSVPVKEFRGALTRAFLEGRLNAGVNFLLARGYTGQTTETLALPGEGYPFERIVGVRQRSYATLSFTYRF